MDAWRWLASLNEFGSRGDKRVKNKRTTLLLFQKLAAFGIACWIAFAYAPAKAQLPAFNGAEGYGGTFTGAAPAGGWFSSASIYHVTNLNDSGAGSLRNAFVENSVNKIIVFDVGGTINLTSGSLDIKNLSNYYIAGQTAPSPITIYGDTTQLTHSSGKVNSNVILRYMSFRKGTGDGEDAITFAGSGTGTNLILDHVSASWSEDENLSVTNNNTNVTVQYSMINDALVNNHAYGSLLRAKIDSNVSLHHNLYANNASRQARFGSYESHLLTADFRNNVVYNWRDRASYTGGSSEAEQEFSDVNYVGNYLVAGSGTLSNANRAYHVDKNVDTRVYQSGNFVDSDKSLNPGGVPNGSDLGWSAFVVSTPVTDQTLTQMSTAFTVAPVTTQSAIDAYNQVLQHVGNFWWSREAIDARTVNNVLTNTGPPNGVAAAAPNAAELSALLATPTTSRTAGWDTDNDGMPDVWEVAHGLNPNLNTDFKLDFDSDGYINLQEYLDETGAFPAPAPIVFNGATNSRYSVITNWKTKNYVSGDTVVHPGSNWQATRFDEAQINGGTVGVDAAGQHAKVLMIGSNAGDNATLNITSGWLDVANQLVIGADPGATAALNLSGGVLSAPTLNKGTGGSFNFTGGTLHADTVNFNLVNNGGSLSPGHSIGQTHVVGSLTLATGSVAIELASTSLADSLLVDGAVQLGGSLNVSLLGSFTPANGNSWQIITAGGINGNFASVTAGYSVQKHGNNLMLYFGAVPPLGIAGDFNGNGTVDAADYVVWRNAGSTDVLLNDPTPGTVDSTEYDLWRAHFGQVTGSGEGLSFTSAEVPEPTTFWIAMGLSAVFTVLRCRTERLSFYRPS